MVRFTVGFWAYSGEYIKGRMAIIMVWMEILLGFNILILARNQHWFLLGANAFYFVGLLIMIMGYKKYLKGEDLIDVEVQDEVQK